MIRETMRKETFVRSVIAEQTIICNRCGTEISTIVDGEEQWDERDQYHKIELCGGFGNHMIGDMNQVVIHLCLPCVGNLLDSMAIIPMIGCGVHEWSWTEWQANGRSWIKEIPK